MKALYLIQHRMTFIAANNKIMNDCSLAGIMPHIPGCAVLCEKRAGRDIYALITARAARNVGGNAIFLFRRSEMK